MRPNTPSHEADGDTREHHERVAEQGFAAERGNHFRHDSEGRQNDDVDLRVPEYPEQVLP